MVGEVVWVAAAIHQLARDAGLKRVGDHVGPALQGLVAVHLTRDPAGEAAVDVLLSVDGVVLVQLLLDVLIRLFPRHVLRRGLRS